MKLTFNKLKKGLFILGFFVFSEVISAQQNTYCNPVNIDYTYMGCNSDKDLAYRSGADPVVVKFRNEYDMFVTRFLGYRLSKDLHKWEFITPDEWYFQGSNAPVAFNYRDLIL